MTTPKKDTKKKTSLAEATKALKETPLIEEDPPVRDYLSTGCTIFDLAIADQYPGGIPMGRLTEIYGPPSTCKSVIAMTLAGEMQRRGGIVFYDDVESTFDYQWAKLYGLDATNADTFRLYTGKDAPLTIEQFFDEDVAGIIKLSEKDKRPKLLICDTLAALSSTAEREMKLDDASYNMSRAKIISQALRVYSPPVLDPANLTILLLNQIRDKVGGSSFGPTTTVSGGWAPKFMGSVRVELKHRGRNKNSKDLVVGINVKFSIEKNKVGPPFRAGFFDILFDYGLDDITTSLEFLKLVQPSCTTKGHVAFNGEEKMVYVMVKYVETNGLEEALRKQVAVVWKDVHSTKDRKPRNWSGNADVPE